VIKDMFRVYSPKKLYEEQKVPTLMLILSVVLFLAFLSFSPANASEYASKENKLFFRGVENYRNGDLGGAVRALSHVLVCDPGNDEARGYLKRIALKYRDTDRIKVRLLRYVELSDYILFLKDRVDDLGNKIGEETEHKDSSFIGQYCKDISSSATEELTLLIRETRAIKQAYVNELTTLQELADKKRRSGGDAFAKNYLDVSGRELLKDNKDLVVEIDNELKNIPEEYSFVNKKISLLQEMVKKSEEKISDLTGELASQSMQLFEKENILAEQEYSFMSLQSQLTDARERLNLVQKIINEKNQKIQALEMHVEEVKLSDKRANNESKKQLDILSMQFETIQYKVDSEKELREEKLAALEKLLAEQEQAIAQHGSLVQKKDTKIEDLSGKLIKSSEDISSLKTVLDSKDDKLVELNGIIGIYRHKLASKNKELEQQKSQLGVLRGELFDTQKQLDLSYEVTRELYEKIMALESHFSHIRTRK